MIKLCFIKTGPAGRQERGFTLVELIITIVLVGIIGTFTTLFMYTGLNGYLRAKDNAAAALKAQIVLDRLSLELRDIDAISTFTPSPDPTPAIEYTSKSLSADRRIRYDGADRIFIRVGSDENVLLDKVASFSIAATYADLNLYPDGNNEVKAIDINFTVEEVGRQFSARIFPRNMVSEP